MFMPIWALSNIKTLIPEQVKDTNAEIILFNKYHLCLRPIEEVVKNSDGLHKNIESWNFDVFKAIILGKIQING
jgi:queuine tRNA-ribosyltransferase